MQKMPQKKPEVPETVSEAVVKLSIVASLVKLLAAIDFNLVEGAGSELTLADDSMFEIIVRRKKGPTGA